LKLITDAVVIGQSNLRENDKLLTLLTREYGVIRAFANKARQVSGRLTAATQLLAFSDFVIFKGKTAYTVDQATVKTIFHKLFSDIDKLSLAQYFCELMVAAAPSEEDATYYLRLLLNALHYIGEGQKPLTQIKAAVEMRLLTLSGYMPRLVGCDKCGQYSHETMLFLHQSGSLLCGDCFTAHPPRELSLQLSEGALTGLRHTVYADFEKLFAFTLSDSNMALLGQSAELYLLSQLDRHFGTLDFYKSIQAVDSE